jgi:membrane associated rhomboid family serine protease
MTNWESEISLPSKPEGIEYAYIRKSNDEMVVCDKDKLLRTISYENAKFVATPDHETFIIPGADYITLKPLIDNRKDKTKGHTILSGVFTLLFGGIAILIGTMGDGWIDASLKINVIIFGVLPFINGFYELYSLKRINENNYYNESFELKFNFWLHKQKVISIFIITGILASITIFQFIAGLSNSIEIVGLVKPKTLQGDFWRILTCTLLHASILHIVFNGLAIYFIGRMVIRITSLSHFFIVFLFSGILGSIFSLYLLPDKPSVGASGGIMGLIGFILVLGLKQKKAIPRNIVKSMVNSIVLIAVLGFMAYDIIDNAAHGGGLLGGIILGLLLIRSKKGSIPYRANLFVRAVGFYSMLILILGVVIIVSKLF